jgi:putative endonuclease
MMAFWTYMLLCADGKYYVGHTDDLERRINEHQSGLMAGFTSSRLPVKLVWSEYFQTRYEAIEAELKIKKWSSAKKAALARGDWDSVSYFAKPPSERGARPHGVSTALDTNGEESVDNDGDGRALLSTPFVSSEVETPISQKPPPK